MSTLGSYPTRDFSETQKFLVYNPETQSTSLVLGRDLVEYIAPPQSTYVVAEQSRAVAQNEDYQLGTLIQTAGDLAAGDNFAGTFLVVPGGDGDFPMVNGNDLLIIKGDVLLREQLASNAPGEGSDLVVRTGTSDTVTETLDRHAAAIDKRVIYVGSVAELPDAQLIDGAQYQTAEFWGGEGVGGNTYTWRADTNKALHNGISIIDPDKIAELVEPGDFGAYFAAPGSGTGCFVTTTSDFDIHVTQAGAVKDTESYPAINAYALYMTDRHLEAVFTGGPYLFDQTIDLTASSYRIAKLRGDCEDANNVGVYNLQYTGSGTAIIADELIMTRLGLAGTAHVADAIPRNTIALQANESWILIQSYIRNFGTIVDVNGGFYSKVYGGRYQRAVKLFNYNTPIYNAEFDGQFNDFEYGVHAGGGNGPVVLKGAWEKFTRGVLLAKNGSDQFGCELHGIYIENYPSQAIAAGLTGPSANYESEVAIFTGDGSVKGTGTIFVDGITRAPIDTDDTDIINTSIEWFDGGSASRPDYLYEAASCRALHTRDSFRQNNFSGISEVSPDLGSAYTSAGTYTAFDGRIKSPVTERQTANLQNGWEAPDGVFVTAGGGVVNIRGTLVADNSTASNFITLPAALRPRQEARNVVQTNVAGTNYTAVGRVLIDGTCRVQNMDATDFTSGVARFSVTFTI